MEHEEELLQKVDQKRKHWKTNFDSLFTSPYCDSDGTLKSFIQKIYTSLESDSVQTKFFVGLVQATLSGKTRLIIEASVFHPIILISFKKGNKAYWDTLLSSIKSKNANSCASFEERLFQNRIILLKVQLFILSFLDFALMYKNLIIGKKSWKDVDRETKLILCALLLNGGNQLVNSFFKKRLEELQEDNLKHSDFQSKKHEINDELKKRLIELEQPWIAFDECHVPQYECEGLLFHSDYETRPDKASVFKWQQYEQYRVVDKAMPPDYPYKAPTTLFSAFRWISEQLLLEGSTMTIFATTHYSCWNSILDDRIYSRSKPRIQPFSALQHLRAAEVRTLLTEFYKIDVSLQQMLPENSLTVWEARPGFLLDIALPSLVPVPQSLASLQDALKAAIEAAETDIKSKFQSIKSDDIPLLHYLVAVHNGVSTNQEIIDRLVAAGIAIKGSDSAVLCEQLVLQHLHSLPANDLLDHTMVQYLGANSAVLGERAVALQLLRYKGTVAGLLTSWGAHVLLPESTLKIFEQFELKFTAAGNFDEFRIVNAADAFHKSSPLWRNTVLLARTGLSLPDILCVGRHESEARVLISIQVKTWSDRPSPPGTDGAKERITAIVQNVSRPHFFAGHDSLKKTFNDNWQECLKRGAIYHLRVIVCWAGFTSQQVQLVQKFNQKNPSQPIVLVWPRAMENSLYGFAATTRLNESVSKEPWSKEQNKMKIPEATESVFAQYANMQLEPEELLLEVLKLYEDSE